MQAVTLKTLKRDLNKIIERANADCEEVVVARNKGGAVVIVPIEMWNSMQRKLNS